MEALWVGLISNVEEHPYRSKAAEKNNAARSEFCLFLLPVHFAAEVSLARGLASPALSRLESKIKVNVQCASIDDRCKIFTHTFALLGDLT